MLKDFKLVGTDGLGSVNYNGTDYPISEIDDAIAAKLYGKTHIIEKVAGPVAAVPATVAPEGEGTPATKSRRNS
ncbi:hypothetical protein GCM10027048_20320 [Hymenobacter coalescens]